METHSSILSGNPGDRGALWAIVHGVAVRHNWPHTPFYFFSVLEGKPQLSRHLRWVLGEGLSPNT